MLIEPKIVPITLPDGSTKDFVLSKVPAVQCREIVAKYPLSAMPKLGDYKVNEETMLKLISFAAVDLDNGQRQQLTTVALINNHCASWETLARLEMAMLEYNISFFGNGKGSTFLEAISQKAQAWITGTLIPSLQQSLANGKPPGTN